MTRKVTFTCELEEKTLRALEERATAEGRSIGEVVADHLARHLPNGEPTPDGNGARAAAFERHIGAWDSGDPASADNERIDADLAREYGSDNGRDD
jgi:hypothetical protein